MDAACGAFVTRSRAAPAASLGTHARRALGGGLLTGVKTRESSVSHTHDVFELRGVRTVAWRMRACRGERAPQWKKTAQKPLRSSPDGLLFFS